MPPWPKVLRAVFPVGVGVNVVVLKTRVVLCGMVGVFGKPVVTVVVITEGVSTEVNAEVLSLVKVKAEDDAEVDSEEELDAEVLDSLPVLVPRFQNLG